MQPAESGILEYCGSHAWRPIAASLFLGAAFVASCFFRGKPVNAFVLRRAAGDSHAAVVLPDARFGVYMALGADLAHALTRW